MLVKDGRYVSGLCEDCAVGGAYLVREDSARAKKCQEQLVLLTMGKYGAGKDGGGSDNYEGFVSVEMAEEAEKW